MRSKNFLIVAVILLLFVISCYFIYNLVYLEYSSIPEIGINGELIVTVKYGDTYNDTGAVAFFRGKDITDKLVVNNNSVINKLGESYIIYTVSMYGKEVSASRVIRVVDTIEPTITLKGDSDITLTLGTDFVEPGYSALDDYDGDVTDKVIVSNDIDSSKEGNYKVTYAVLDSSGNSYTVSRNVNYIKPKVVYKTLPKMDALASKIAVLNYHFFYNEGEYSGDGNFTSVETFDTQMKYLKENGYKTLTMEEFRAWMYGEMELPARSVLITIDDGGTGTGLDSGNKMIPVLKKYDLNATLFLITAWWGGSNYPYEKLDIESHGHDLHVSSYCSGVSRGAKMLCLNDEEVKTDLQNSINSLGKSTAFCFPFYAYSNKAIELVKDVGFKLAFIGGDNKATRSGDKYKIPRYHMYKWTSMQQFVDMIA